jgi:hypothetical protein
MIRPGPERLAPGANPGNFVWHCYAIPTLRLVEVITSLDQAQGWAGPVLAPRETGSVLVCYDGDTGERMLPPGYKTGDRL